MTVKTTLKVYADDHDISTSTELVVESHWNTKDEAWLIIDGKKWLVRIEELRKALVNAGNH